MSLVKKENSFLIERTDRLSESSDIYSVYNYVLYFKFEREISLQR